jgi:hypothetical protein
MIKVARCRESGGRWFGNTALVIIFILLGLGFLGGGVALVVEGWPYMVLERGFTQVIAGTVLASAGVILLALSRVLSELGRVRSTLSNAVMAASLASMATREEPALSEAFALEPMPRREPAQSLSSLPTGLVLGGVAAAGLAGAALARAGADEAEASKEQKPGEADLFGVIAPPAVAPVDDDEVVAPVPTVADEAQLLPFDDAGWLDRALGKDLAVDAAEDPEIVRSDSPAVGSPAGVDDPFADADLRSAAPRPDEPVRAAGDSEFDFLRDSLAHLRPGRDEAERPRTDDGDIRDAAAWMSPMREDVAIEPVVPAQEPHRRDDDPDRAADEMWEPPAWPPVTQAISAEPDHSETPEHVDDPVPAEAAPAAIVAEATSKDEAQATAAEIASEIPSEPSAPATSDEGVIGAYQVGDAHFTIYADGSIQARTPDGDYRFDSMDELKTYLASEKSRLGM